MNIQGFLPTAELLMAEQGYAEVLKALGVGFFKFPDFGLPRDCDDRSLWNFCQALGLARLTDNRNDDGQTHSKRRWTIRCGKTVSPS